MFDKAVEWEIHTGKQQLRKERVSGQAAQNDILISLFHVKAVQYLRIAEKLSFPSLHDITGLKYYM